MGDGRAHGLSGQCLLVRGSCSRAVPDAAESAPGAACPGTTPASTQVGVLGPVVGQAGTAMATEAIKMLVGFGEPLIGRVLMVDATTQRTDVLTFAPWE